MKLIKLSEEHYIGVDESEIKEGDFVYSSDGGIFKRHINNPCQTIFPISKITHSTQPIEEWKSVSYGGDGTIRKKIYDKIKPLSLQDVKELFGLVDVEKKAAELAYSRRIKYQDSFDDGVCSGLEEGYEIGYNQALEDNKERKYTEDDLRKAIDMAQKESWDEGGYLGKEHEPDEIIQSLQPKTEWEVEFVDGKLKLK